MSSVGQHKPVLVLGGTAEAREVSRALAETGIPVVSSLAGRVTHPGQMGGQTRIGGFGGPDGLADWLREQCCAAMIDATHPFAAQISQSAVAASAFTGVPLVRLVRPGWMEQRGDRWYWVDDVDEAAELMPRLGTRVLLAIGRQRLSAFAKIRDAWFLARCIDRPRGPLPRKHEILLARGPFTPESERQLFAQYEIDLVVARDSGGPSTEAKLTVARERGLPVIMVRRPMLPDAFAVECASQAAEWACSLYISEIP
jgi:precorrin-6A/cobalt-precorrin-6A reductase